MAPKLISKAVENITMHESWIVLEVDYDARLYCVNMKNTQRVTKPSMAPVSISVLRPNLVNRMMTKGTATQLTPNKMKVPKFSGKLI